MDDDEVSWVVLVELFDLFGASWHQAPGSRRRPGRAAPEPCWHVAEAQCDHASSRCATCCAHTA